MVGFLVSLLYTTVSWVSLLQLVAKIEHFKKAEGWFLFKHTHVWGGIKTFKGFFLETIFMTNYETLEVLTRTVFRPLIWNLEVL